MQAAGKGSGGTGGTDGQGGDPGRSRRRYDCGAERPAEGAAAPQAEGPLQAPGQGVELSASAQASAAAAQGQESQVREFRLTVSFPSITDAEIALRYLAPDTHPFRGVVRRQFTLIGNKMVIRIAAENPGLLQMSITSLINQLSLVMQAMQRFGSEGKAQNGRRL